MKKCTLPHSFSPVLILPGRGHYSTLLDWVNLVPGYKPATITPLQYRHEACAEASHVVSISKLWQCIPHQYLCPYTMSHLCTVFIIQVPSTSFVKFKGGRPIILLFSIMPLASIANNQIVEIEAINFPACGLAQKMDRLSGVCLTRQISYSCKL